MSKLSILLVVLMGLAAIAQADEGMWMMNQLQGLDLKDKGLEISPEDLYNPDGTSVLDAIVWLGGCSASFVSDQGLVLTNHHCAYGALQRNASQSGIDYIKQGFLAGDRSEELPAMGTYAYTIQSISDVSTQVLAAANKETDLNTRKKLIDKKIADMVAGLEGNRDDMRVRIVPMFEGREFWQFIYKKYQDVRIVYAPPASIGKYGGDIDNWMWPRHTGDFTYLRVYQGPDGSGAKYSPDNVPLHPKNHLKIARQPLQEGDFSFILGFPGRTTRWQTSYSVAWNLEHKFKARIKQFSEILDMMDAFGAESQNAKIKLAGFHAGLANAMKNYQGNVDGIKRTAFISSKKAYEQKLQDFIEKDKKRQKEFGTLFSELENEFKVLDKRAAYEAAVNDFRRLSGTLSGLAFQVYGFAREREKPLDARDADFSEKSVARSAGRLKYRFLSFYLPFDKAMLVRAIKKAKAQDVPGVAYINDVQTFVDKAYAETKLSDPKFAKTLFNKSLKELEALNDPFINLAAALYDASEQVKKEQEARGARLQALRKEYIKLVSAFEGREVYPDANGTIRFTYGYIKGYQPRDAVRYAPFTTLSGVVAKNTGEEPFDMPTKLGQLEADKDFGKWQDKALGDVPVAFLNTCDITGGNSGSAVMNARGELIGLAFDGNYEAMTGDWQFDDQIQRTIAVDIRYVLFITEKFAGADYLLKEMQVD